MERGDIGSQSLMQPLLCKFFFFSFFCLQVNPFPLKYSHSLGEPPWLSQTSPAIPLPQPCIALTKDLAASVLMLNNTVIFSSRQKVASTLESEAVFFHLMNCTQCIAYSNSFEHPVPGDGDAHRVAPCATPPVPPPPPPRLVERSQGTATAKWGAAV